MMVCYLSPCLERDLKLSLKKGTDPNRSRHFLYPAFAKCPNHKVVNPLTNQPINQG